MKSITKKTIISSTKPNQWQTNKFGGLIKNSVSSIINHYKGRVTKYANKNKILFQWQPKFYDRIIRDEKELNRIRKYIHENPMKWDSDKNNFENLYM